MAPSLRNESRQDAFLLTLKKHKTCISCLLEFNCTNNTVIYEALVQGLNKAINLNLKCLRIFGDLEIIVRHVRNIIHCFSPHLKGYQNEVWNLTILLMHLISPLYLIPKTLLQTL
jgi:ribonuclease HI